MFFSTLSFSAKLSTVAGFPILTCLPSNPYIVAAPLSLLVLRLSDRYVLLESKDYALIPPIFFLSFRSG